MLQSSSNKEVPTTIQSSIGGSNKPMLCIHKSTIHTLYAAIWDIWSKWKVRFTAKVLSHTKGKQKDEKKIFKREEVVKKQIETPKLRQIIPRLLAKPENIAIKYGPNDSKLYYSSFFVTGSIFQQARKNSTI